MAEQRARLERDGDMGVLVLDDPPLNLFGREMVSDILGALDESDGVRALLVRAEGEYFTGGADVKVRGPVRAGRRALHDRPARDHPPDRRAALPDARLGARPLPDPRARAVAGLRHDLGVRVGALRAG